MKPAAPAKPEPKKKVKAKHDPQHVAMARELRDRWLERVNADPSLLLSVGKYEVSRMRRLAPCSKTAAAIPYAAA